MIRIHDLIKVVDKNGYIFDSVLISILYAGYLCMQDTFARATRSPMQPLGQARARDDRVSCIQKIPLLARRTRPVGQARRATIGYLVYKFLYCTQDTFARATHSAGRPSAVLDDRVSCIQISIYHLLYRES